MRLKCLSCESLARPVYYSAAHSPHLVDVTLVERHLHNPREIRGRLQEMIDAADPAGDPARERGTSRGASGQGYDAIALAFGLCGQVTSGLIARSVPLVLPRAHDCITLFLGSRARYLQEQAREPGTYWYAQDYIERNSGDAVLAMGSPTDSDTQAIYEKYVNKYGKAKADRLMEIMNEWLTHYKRAVYLDTELGDGSATEAQARAQAERHNWQFERITADLNLVRRLLEGQWDTDFLVVQPGQRVAMAYDDDIITSEDA
jgi:hypothetical protein